MDKTDDLPAPSERAALTKHLAAGVANRELRSYLVSQLLNTLWNPGKQSEQQGEDRLRAALAALNGLKPADEAEGMLGVQMIATHHAAVDCLQQAIGDEAERDRRLVHAERLLTLYVRQLQALDRRRGLGANQVNVGTVNVESGAQAIVGQVAREPQRPE